jgi:3-deoxy-manno-octulosonate cytidylyltransferase (CMP-KDO synthetase)
MGFCVLIPARLASTRLPDKPLADIGGAPMVVRVAQRAALSSASRVVVAADDARIVQACEKHGVLAVLTAKHHPSGSDRLAQACDLLGLADTEIVVNVQGDEPLIEPSLIDAVAGLLDSCAEADMSTAAHPIADEAEFRNPNVVKTVLDANGIALYFSRAPIPFWRDGPAPAASAGAAISPPLRPLRHVGIYGYRAGFLRLFPKLAQAPVEQAEALEQLRALWHGHRIAVHVTDAAPGIGVDTPEDLERVRALWGRPAA